MATSRSEQQLIRTTDLTLAAYLIHEGFNSEMVETDAELRDGRPQGAWEFVETPALRRVIDEFNNGEARVEPTTFHGEINKTRKAMFSFLRIG